MHYELSSTFPNINLKKEGKEYLLRVFLVFFFVLFLFFFSKKASRKKTSSPYCFE